MTCPRRTGGEVSAGPGRGGGSAAGLRGMAGGEACVRTREPAVWDRCALARWRSAARQPRDRAERVGDAKAAALPYRKEAREAGGGPSPWVGLRGLPSGPGQRPEGVARPIWARPLRPLEHDTRLRGRGRPTYPLSVPSALEGWPKPWLRSPGSAARIRPLGLVQISRILQLRHRKKE